MLSLIPSEVWAGLAAAAVAAFSLGLTWLKARRAGQDIERRRQMEQAAKQRNTRDEIDRAVAREPDPLGELRRDWSRPD